MIRSFRYGMGIIQIGTSLFLKMHVASYNIDYVISRTYLLYKLVRVVRHFIIPLLFIFVVICVARRARLQCGT